MLEDDDNLREILVDLLEDGGHQVSGANGSDEALALASSQVYDVMVSDIRMAGKLDGIATVRKIKKENLPNLIVIMMTGYASTEAPARAVEGEVDLYLLKDELKVSFVLGNIERLLAQREKSRKGIFRQLVAPLIDRPLQIFKTTLESQKSNAEAQRLIRGREVLQEEKLKTYKSYVVGITSKTLFDSASQEIWYGLADIEGKALRTTTFEQMHYLRNQYRSSQEQICKFMKKPSNVRPKPPEGATARQVLNMLDRVKRAKITADELQHAEAIRLAPAQVREKNPEWQALYEAVWL